MYNNQGCEKGGPGKLGQNVTFLSEFFFFSVTFHLLGQKSDIAHLCPSLLSENIRILSYYH